ncbi:MAG: T9SS type A sorting domain-containing protein [Saprospiraceae bacterium]|nr:T9SS type A sorting domain-containing protein [Saprospiraceae bacterium]
MKKAVLLILCNLSVFLIHAQIKLDSVLTDGNTKIVFTYDETGKAIESIEYQLEATTSQWELYQRKIWTYVFEETTQTTYDWNHTLQQWMPSERTVFKDSPEFLYEIYEWNASLGVWIGISKEYSLITPFGHEYYNDSWNSATLDWRYWLKSISHADQNQNITETISYSWINNTWALTSSSWRTQFSYDAEGRNLEEIQARWNTSTSSWVSHQKATWEYDALGQTTDNAIYLWNDNANEWTGWIRSAFAYENTRLISRTNFNWDGNGNIWNPFERYFYTYNTDSTLIISDLYLFDSESENWIYERPQSESLLYYTPDGKLSERIDSYWRGEPFNVLTYSDKTNYAYDEAGHVIDYATYRWNAFLENWYNVHREIKGYDLTVDASELIFHEAYSYLFENGKLTFFRLYSLDPIFNDWQLDSESYYYFSEFITGADEANAATSLKLFPNPAGDLLTPGANAPRASSYQITDLNGRILQQEKSWNGKGIDVSQLIPGSYVIRMMEGNRVVTGKFMKL